MQESDNSQIFEQLEKFQVKPKGWMTTIILVIFFNLLGWFLLWLYLPILMPKLEKNFSYSYAEIYTLKNKVNNLSVQLEDLKNSFYNNPHDLQKLEQKVSNLEKKFEAFSEKTLQQIEKIQISPAPLVNTIISSPTKASPMIEIESLLTKIYYKGKKGKPFVKYLRKLPHELQEHKLIKLLKPFSMEKTLNLKQLISEWDKLNEVDLPIICDNFPFWQKFLNIVKIEKIEKKSKDSLKSKVLACLKARNLTQAITTIRQYGLEKSYQSWIEKAEKRINLDKILKDMIDEISNLSIIEQIHDEQKL